MTSTSEGTLSSRFLERLWEFGRVPRQAVTMDLRFDILKMVEAYYYNYRVSQDTIYHEAFKLLALRLQLCEMGFRVTSSVVRIFKLEELRSGCFQMLKHQAE